MKLESFYDNKLCPHKTKAYWCDGQRCVKFVSCMKNEIDALYAISGINTLELDTIEIELIKMLRDEKI